MRYIITGASGHIGNNLVRYLNKTDPLAEIVIISRRKTVKELEGATFSQRVGDITDRAFLEEIITRDDVVIHLAGVIDLTDKKEEETYRINYLSTKLICDTCLNKNVKKFVYVGSVDGIYKTGEEAEICEPEEYFPDKLLGNYGKTKALATGYVKSVIDNNPDFNGCFVLPSAVIGENDFKPSAVGKVVLNTVNGKPEIGIPGGYNFVYVGDVVKAIKELSLNDFKGGLILSGESVTIKEFYGYICNALGKKSHPLILPLWLAKLASPFVKVLNKITLKALNETHNYSNKKAKTVLGIDFVSAQTAIKHTTEWFAKNKELFK